MRSIRCFSYLYYKALFVFFMVEPVIENELIPQGDTIGRVPLPKALNIMNPNHLRVCCRNSRVCSGLCGLRKHAIASALILR
jgi:hypothetical protein